MGGQVSVISDSVDRKHTHVRTLGSGAFGTVSAVKSKSTGDLIARKDIYFGAFFGLSRDEFRFQSACNEVQVITKLRHPNIVRVYSYELFTEKKTMSVYMECCETSVDKLCTQLNSTGGSLPGPMLTHIATSVLRALEYLHHLQPPVLHRDLKPANILVKSRGRNSLPTIKVSDFGVSLIHNHEYAHAAGTREISAPEVLAAWDERRAKRITSASDLYSFGVTMEWLCAFTEPGAHRTAALALAKRCKETDPAKRPTALAARWALERAGPFGTLVLLRHVMARIGFLMFWWCLFTVIWSCPGGFSDAWRLMGTTPFQVWVVCVIGGGVAWKKMFGSWFMDDTYDGWIAFAIGVGLQYWNRQVMNPGLCPVPPVVRGK